MIGRSNQRFGLDIGSYSIKAVVAEKSGGKLRPVKFVKYDIYPDVDKYDIDGPKRSVAVPAVSEIFKKLGMPTRRVKYLYSNIGGAQVSAKEISTIHLDDEEMASAMLLESRKHIPLDGSQSVIDYQIIGDDPKVSDKVRVIIAATTRKLYDAHVDILKDLELRPGVIDLDQLASVNSYLIGRELPEDGVTIFLNIGCRKTNLTIFGRKDTFFTRDINIAGHHFTEELVKKYGLDYSTAEHVKIEQGMNPDLKTIGVDDKRILRVAEKSVIDRLCDEINRSLRYYVKETGQSIFNQIILIGGSAALKGLDEHLFEKFNINVEIYDPLRSYELSTGEEFGPQYAVATGLAIRGD